MYKDDIDAEAEREGAAQSKLRRIAIQHRSKSGVRNMASLIPYGDAEKEFAYKLTHPEE